jgi:hypothetical protein
MSASMAHEHTIEWVEQGHMTASMEKEHMTAWAEHKIYPQSAHSPHIQPTVDSPHIPDYSAPKHSTAASALSKPYNKNPQS